MQDTVLIVDDEPHVLSALQRALRSEPYETTVANSADVALEVIKTQEVAVIVCDENMPGMCGTALLARLSEDRPEIVRILLTGDASFDVAVRSINDAQVFRFLSKPCRDVELALSVRQALQQRELFLESYVAGFADALEDMGSHSDTADSTIILGPQDPASVGPEDGSMGLRVDDVFDGRYRIEKVLGSGTMGAVFLVNDLQLEERVALKALSVPDDRLEQVREELRFTRRITHKNVVRTYDFGIASHVPYITMEYVDGHTLNHFIERRGPFTCKVGLLISRQICTALHAAHQEGVLHRDLKAQNVLLTGRGVVKITDFGIAMLIHRPGDFDDKGSAESLETQNEARFPTGTPNFMSPEQVLGRELDFRSDVYSLGVLLFYLFSGELPFKSGSIYDVMRAQAEVPAPLMSSVREGLPSELDSIVAQTLEKDRTKRFQTVSEVAEALQNVTL